MNFDDTPQEAEFRATARGWINQNAPKQHAESLARKSLTGADFLKAAKGWQKKKSDGGWAQLDYRASDAYATGQVLVALHEAGVSARSPAYQRGVRYLLDTQLADGSWLVPSRTLPTQIYFESGFPHEVHQFISAAGTQWATQALAWSVQ